VFLLKNGKKVCVGRNFIKLPREDESTLRFRRKYEKHYNDGNFTIKAKRSLKKEYFIKNGRKLTKEASSLKNSTKIQQSVRFTTKIKKESSY
jgi:hypothetical protein